ncbi:MAG: transporter, partial [Bacteroidales bacterium]
IPSLSLIEDAENISPDLTLAGSWTLSSNMGIGFNLGFHWPGFGLGNPNFFYSAVIGISHGKKLSTFWEIYGFRHEVLEDLAYYEAGLSTNDFRADLGLTYLLKPNFQLDLSSGLGFSKISPDFFVAIGFSWRIPR